jgi:hypothetical protein
MNEERIYELLRWADTVSAPSGTADDLADVVRRRARSVRGRRRIAGTAAAAIVVAACACAAVFVGKNHERSQSASLEARVRSLEMQVQSSQRLVDALRAEESDRLRLRKMQDELAQFDDPLATLARLDDRTAFVMVYEADRLYRELNLTGSAVGAYKRVIELFPANRWAQVAGERLAEIEQDDADENSGKEI